MSALLQVRARSEHAVPADLHQGCSLGDADLGTSGNAEHAPAGLQTWFAEEAVPTSSHLSQLRQSHTHEAGTPPGQQAPPTMLAVGE